MYYHDKTDANFFLNIAAFAARILPNSFKQAIYKVKPLARLIRGGLNRAAPTGLVEVKVAAGDLAGFHHPARYAGRQGLLARHL